MAGLGRGQRGGGGLLSEGVMGGELLGALLLVLLEAPQHRRALLCVLPLAALQLLQLLPPAAGGQAQTTVAWRVRGGRRAWRWPGSVAGVSRPVATCLRRSACPSMVETLVCFSVRA